MFSYGEPCRFDFNASVTQLTGANGSGKSSIPAILEDLFYNKNSRGVKKGALKNRLLPESKMYSRSEFLVGEDVYFLDKKTASTTKVLLTKNGTDISGHTATQTYEILHSTLGMDFTTFSKLVYQSMTSSLDFLLSTDANRKKFLVSLLGLERYGEIAASVKQAVSDTKKELAAEQGALKSLRAIVAKPIPQMKPEVTVPDPYKSDLDFEALTREIDEAKQLNARIKANNAAITRLQALITVVEPIPPYPEEKAKQLSSDLATADAELKLARKELNTLSVPADTCYACGSLLDNQDQVAKIKARKLELEQQINHLESVRTQVFSSLAAWNEYTRALPKYLDYVSKKEALTSSVDKDLPIELEDTSYLESKIALEKKKEKESELKVKQAESLNNEVRVSNAKADAMLEQKREVEDQVNLKNVLVSQLENELETLEVLNQTFGTKGLISYKIESTTKVFEGLINEYLSVLSAGRFNLTFEIEDTKLSLKVFDYGEQIEIASLSSGEFNRVNTACLLAIRKMLSAVSKVDINILFLDEVVSVLDKEGKDILIEVLLKEQNLNSVVVSHGYIHPLTKRVYVDKVNGISQMSEEDNVS